jgi:hypothetical protein
VGFYESVEIQELSLDCLISCVLVDLDKICITSACRLFMRSDYKKCVFNLG